MLASFESFCNLSHVLPSAKYNSCVVKGAPKPSATQPIPAIFTHLQPKDGLAYLTQNLTQSHLKSPPARPNSIFFLSFSIAGLYLTLALVFSFV